MEPRLCLVVIRSRDLATSRRFYEAIGLTFREEQHGNGPRHLTCILGDTVFEIYPVSSDEDSTTSARLGFRIRDIELALSAVVDRSGTIVSQPKASPWGKRAVVRDPDGHVVELVEG